jgi:hypothetical protein
MVAAWAVPTGIAAATHTTNNRFSIGHPPSFEAMQRLLR